MPSKKSPPGLSDREMVTMLLAIVEVLLSQSAGGVIPGRERNDLLAREIFLKDRLARCP